jgi:hypothetical protein
MSANRIAAGMNRYRHLNVLLASWLLSGLIFLTLTALADSVFVGWGWWSWVAVAAVPFEVFLGVAQMTSWRWKP